MIALACLVLVGCQALVHPRLGAQAGLVLTPPLPPRAAIRGSGGSAPGERGERAFSAEQLLVAERVLGRGDASCAAERELADQTGASVEYFASERVPSALIASATLGILFAVSGGRASAASARALRWPRPTRASAHARRVRPRPPAPQYPFEPAEARLAALPKRLYTLLCTTSLCNSLLAVFASSLAIVRLSGHAHEPRASEPLTMMLREVRRRAAVAARRRLSRAPLRAGAAMRAPLRVGAAMRAPLRVGAAMRAPLRVGAAIRAPDRRSAQPGRARAQVPLLFLAVRAHYLSGLLLFVAALGVRVLVDFSHGAPAFAKGLACLLGAALAAMGSLFNTSLTRTARYDSFAHMWRGYCAVLLARLRDRSPALGRRAGPCALCALVLLCAAALCFGASARVFFFP